MSIVTDWKHWTLRNERALEAMARKNWAVKVVANVYKLAADEIRAWLNEFNSSSETLTPARLDQVRRELGIISEGKATGAKPAAPRSPEAAPSYSEDLAKGFARPWLKFPRRPRAAAVNKHRKLLERVVRGEAVKVDHAQYQFLRRIFGNVRPGKDQAAAFLEWYDQPPGPADASDSARNDKPAKGKKARKIAAPKPAKAKRKYTRRPASQVEVEMMPAPADKPPVGLRPRWLVEEQRIEEITAAMLRYLKAGVPVPNDWILELAEKLEARKATVRLTVPYAKLAGGAD